jgi:hypothetical protein
MNEDGRSKHSGGTRKTPIADEARIAGGGSSSAGPSTQGVRRDVDEEDDAAVDLGSELSFPASDPPAYMGAGAITGPPMRDAAHPQAPVVSKHAEEDPRDDPSVAEGRSATVAGESGRAERRPGPDPSGAAAGSEIGGDLDMEQADTVRAR